jgi:hypothetical protein
MESALALNVPLIVEIGQGKNWDEAHWNEWNSYTISYLDYFQF